MTNFGGLSTEFNLLRLPRRVRVETHFSLVGLEAYSEFFSAINKDYTEESWLNH